MGFGPIIFFFLVDTASLHYAITHAWAEFDQVSEHFSKLYGTNRMNWPPGAEQEYLSRSMYWADPARLEGIVEKQLKSLLTHIKKS